VTHLIGQPLLQRKRVESTHLRHNRINVPLLIRVGGLRSSRTLPPSDWQTVSWFDDMAEIIDDVGRFLA
jgi:hypothetical protein